MHRADLATEIARFDPDLALEEAWTPPASWYVEPGFLEVEAETVFSRHWLCAARADQVSEPGSYATSSSLRHHHVVVRADDGQLRGFHNVCRHHATLVMEGAGRCSELVCPYHGWTYDLQGRLRRAPRAGGMRDFDRDDFGLSPVAAEEWGPMVFVHADPAARPVGEGLGALREQLQLDGLRFVARREYRIRCNWKVYVDNYLDGGYHVPVAHSALAGNLDLASYRTEVFDTHVVQSCAGDASERLGDRATYAWIHPNLMLNRYGPILDTNLVLPLGPEETLVVFDYFFEEGRADDTAFVEQSLAASDAVQREDVELCERVQRGLASRAYDRGRYAPLVEGGMLHFHRLLARDLA